MIESKRTIALITAAGRGSRIVADYEVPKQYLKLCGISILRHSINIFLKNPEIDNVLVIIHRDDIGLYKEAIAGLDILPPVFGGDTRQESVRLGLESLKSSPPQKVLIHDAARPFVTQKIITSVIKQLDVSPAVIPAIPVDDTIKKCGDGKILWTVERSDLWRAQTPQGFIFSDILHYHNIYKDKNFTDDAAIKEYAGIPVTIIPGSQNNFKITTDEDFEQAGSVAAFNFGQTIREVRVGIGYDIHAFEDIKSDSETIMLGGVKVNHPFKLIGHSDSDALLHAITDALLGTVGGKDIGTHFSDKDVKWKGTNSADFLKYAHQMVLNAGGKIINIDTNIICERPKIGNYRNAIQEKIAEILQIKPEKINIKGKTNEKLDAVGRGEAIVCQAIVSIRFDTWSDAD
jgi:2-C-methyl-D-erythritol 4-phosphate cytidylyltransferase / 2-C-methyl-D-erythritol 2,4-cyclodiphosphate synthase